MVLLFAMVVTASAQTRRAGVSVGDWFKYGEFIGNWSSNDPTATPPPLIAEYNEIQWLELNVTAIAGTNITAPATIHYKNGTEINYGGWTDVDTGDGENLTKWFISSNLYAGDAIYSSNSSSNWNLNETIVRNYPDGSREINHISIVSTDQFNYSTDYYWDRLTGVLVENSYEDVNQTGGYTTTWSVHVGITATKLWAVPESFTWTSMLLIIIVLTPATIAIYKRRPVKR